MTDTDILCLLMVGLSNNVGYLCAIIVLRNPVRYN